ncbi:MAG: hypothetical protein AAF587_19425 [Bacteroidota bacterium]
MLDHQRNFLILFVLLGITAVLVYAFLPGATRVYERTSGHEQLRWQTHHADARNVSVVHVDFTHSDSSLIQASSPYRRIFKQVLKQEIKEKEDVLAAFLVHQRTQDNQPFYATHSVYLEDELISSVNGTPAVRLHQDLCMEAFDELVHQYQTPGALGIEDSTLMKHTNLIGAVQNAALYFRKYAKEKDHKRLFFLSDMRENAALVAPALRVDQITRKDQIADLVNIALDRLVEISDVDIEQELKGAEVFVLTPNEHLYSSANRNYIRIFWEMYFRQGLGCKSVYFQ